MYVTLKPDEALKLEEIFDYEFYADWNPEEKPVHPDFTDPQIEAAAAILRGDVPYPRIGP